MNIPNPGVKILHQYVWNPFFHYLETVYWHLKYCKQSTFYPHIAMETTYKNMEENKRYLTKAKTITVTLKINNKSRHTKKCIEI